MVPSKNPIIQKRYYAAYMSNGKVSKFHKNVYQLIKDDRERTPVVVHYFGDHTVAAPCNPKNQDKSMGSNENQFSNYDGERKLAVHRALKPKQVKKSLLSKDDFQELHQIAYGLGNYVKLISHFPDLIVVFALKEISDDLEYLLKLSHEPRPLFSYSNSYELGEYIVSTFLYTHPAFLERPTIPSHFVIHEKTCGQAHQELCRILADMVPSLASTTNPVVLNLDPNKFSAISSVFPNMHTLFSWKDVIANTKAWLYANGASQQEVTVYIEDLRELFSRRSKELYEEALAECKSRWHGFFEEYYMKEIHEVVNDRLGRWALEKWNVYNPYTGVTDKSNEGMEVVIRQLKLTGSSPVHSTILALCLLQRWLYNEVSKSYSGVGPYTVRTEFQNLERITEVFTSGNASQCPPDQILYYIQNKRMLITEGILKEDCTNSELKMNLQSSASQLVKAGAVIMNSKQQSFTVKVNPVTYYETKLFPKVICSCEDMRNGLCAHVLAVKLSLGINIDDDLRKYQPVRTERNKVAEVKTHNSIKKGKREMAVDKNVEIQIPLKQAKQSEEDFSIQKVEIIEQDAQQEHQPDQQQQLEQEEPQLQQEEVENVVPNQVIATDTQQVDAVAATTAATALLQGAIDEGQIQLMQIAASSFRPDVTLNL